jgi:predicted aldo/keto reductase-like oxidoreductase
VAEMRYRRLGRTGLDVSIIGLGMEHVVTSPDEVAPVVRRAIDGGVNYIDMMIWTPQHQDVLGSALAGRRNRVVLAGHLGAAETNGQYRRTRDVGECERLWHDLLRRLGTDYVDVVHLHYVDVEDDYERIIGPGGALELALRLKREGKARFLSLSGHNSVLAQRAVMSDYLDVLMHPINIVEDAEPGKKELCRVCANLGIGLVAMKAFRGGAVFERERPIPPVKCISYSLSQPGVSTVLVGARNREELQTDLAFLDATDEERDFTVVVEDVRQGLEGVCVYCNHCLPCPSNIDISLIMRMLPVRRGCGFGDAGNGQVVRGITLC